MKNLVCYFSATGNTKNVALKVSKILKSDIFEIEPEIKYTEKDLDWTNKKSRSSLEFANPESRPNIKNKIDQLNTYDNILIGFPVWWYKEPNIIDTFIEENDFTNKKIYIFVTSGGSSVSSSLDSLKNKYESLNFVSGKKMDLNINDEEILNWIN